MNLQRHTPAAVSFSFLRKRGGRAVPLPPDVLLLGVACTVFVAIALVLSAGLGVPLVLPTERISPALGIPAAAPLALALAGYLAGQAIMHRRRGDGWSSLVPRVTTDLGYVLLFLVVIYFHFQIKTWMPLANPHLFDAAYFRLDQSARLLLDGVRLVRDDIAQFLPDAEDWYQGAQLGLFVLSFWCHALGHRRWHHHNMTALLLVLMLGPLTYLIAPAVGPFIFENGPNAAATASQHAMYQSFLAVQTHGAAWLAAQGGDHFTAAVAAMPSLHVALACIVTYYAWKARLAAAPLLTFFAFWIFIESVVSRWHYLIDIPPGVALAALVILVANRACRWRLADGGRAAEEAAAR